ncbi:hypothetical protein LINPERPRIM_LOCUS8857 [Linum perenne]
MTCPRRSLWLHHHLVAAEQSCGQSPWLCWQVLISHAMPFVLSTILFLLIVIIEQCSSTKCYIILFSLIKGLPGYTTFNYMISAFLSLTTHQIIKMCEKGFVNQKQICNNELMKKINSNMHVYGALSNLSSLLRMARDSSRIKAAIFTLHLRCDVN